MPQKILEYLQRPTLVEAILEIHWQLAENDHGLPYDDGYDMALGMFKSSLSGSFPFHERLVEQGQPIQILESPKHRYRKNNNLWPVIQHGPGIMTVNDLGKDYSWESRFRSAIITALDALHKSYPRPRNITLVRMTYMNSAKTNGLSPADFAKDNLQVSISRSFEIPGEETGFLLAQGFNLGNQQNLTYTVTQGRQHGKEEDEVLWNIVFNQTKEFELSSDLMETLDFAHDSISQLFRNMLHPKYYASLS